MRAKPHHALRTTTAKGMTNGANGTNGANRANGATPRGAPRAPTRAGARVAMDGQDAVVAMAAFIPGKAQDPSYPRGRADDDPAEGSEEAAPSFPPYELALDAPAEPRLATVQVSREDKAVFDALQAWWMFRRGRRLTQWELFSVLLGDALGNDAGELSGARRVV